MNLEIANKLFKAGKYQEALSIYTEYQNSMKAIDLSLNILLCKSRLSVSNDDISKNLIIKKRNDVSDSALVLLKKSLKEFYDIDVYKTQEYRVNIYKFVNTIKNISLKDLDVELAVFILSISPFQISLLLLVASLLKYKKVDLLKIQCGNDCILHLLKCVADYKYWLDNRSNVIQLMESLNINTGNKKYLNVNFRFSDFDSITLEKNEFFLLLAKIEFTGGEYQKRDITNDKDIKLTIGSILLNEAKFIGLNLANHYNICDEWILIEGACQGYPTRKVTKNGLSKDSSALQILLFPDRYNKIKFKQYGWTKNKGEQAKSELRNEYIKFAKGEILWVLDIDEFYAESDVKAVLSQFAGDENLVAFTLPQVHFWKNLSEFITGSYYDVSHTRFFRNIPGVKYISNHNFPEINGLTLNKINHSKFQRKIERLSNKSYKYDGVRCYHMGFAKDSDDMKDKTEYYINRGENVTRKNTTHSRASWFNNDLPDNCKIYSWGGSYPWVLKALKNDEES